MADSTVNAANQVVNTTQPKPLRGLKLRGIREQEQVLCEDEEGNTFKVAKKNYDPKVHKKVKKTKDNIDEEEEEEEEEEDEDEEEKITRKKKGKKKKKKKK